MSTEPVEATADRRVSGKTRFDGAVDYAQASLPSQQWRPTRTGELAGQSRTARHPRILRIMVNDLCDPKTIEANHEALAQDGTVVRSPEVDALLVAAAPSLRIAAPGLTQ